MDGCRSTATGGTKASCTGCGWTRRAHASRWRPSTASRQSEWSDQRRSLSTRETRQGTCKPTTPPSSPSSLPPRASTRASSSPGSYSRLIDHAQCAYVMPVASIATIEAAKVAVLVHCFYWHESYTRWKTMHVIRARACICIVIIWYIHLWKHYRLLLIIRVSARCQLAPHSKLYDT